MALSAKRRVFIEEYIHCGWNATEAARRAGYRCPHSQGSRLLENVEIQAAINARIAERAMGADEILDRLGEHARGTMADFLEVRNNWVRLDIERAQQAGVLHLVKKFRQTKQGTEVELYDAQAALQLLGKHLGLFKEQTEHSGTIEVIDARSELAARLAAQAARGEAAGGDTEPAE